MMGALQNTPPQKNNEGRKPKGYPTLVVCFKMNVCKPIQSKNSIRYTKEMVNCSFQ